MPIFTLPAATCRAYKFKSNVLEPHVNTSTWSCRRILTLFAGWNSSAAPPWGSPVSSLFSVQENPSTKISIRGKTPSWGIRSRCQYTSNSVSGVSTNSESFVSRPSQRILSGESEILSLVVSPRALFRVVGFFRIGIRCVKRANSWIVVDRESTYLSPSTTLVRSCVICALSVLIFLPYNDDSFHYDFVSEASL